MQLLGCKPPAMTSTRFPLLGTGWGQEAAAGAWPPAGHLEPPAAPTHVTNTEQHYVDRVATTALPLLSKPAGRQQSHWPVLYSVVCLLRVAYDKLFASQCLWGICFTVFSRMLHE